MEYTVLGTISVMELIKAVKRYIDEGWTPLGGMTPHPHTTTYYQTMTRQPTGAPNPDKSMVEKSDERATDLPPAAKRNWIESNLAQRERTLWATFENSTISLGEANYQRARNCLTGLIDIAKERVKLEYEGISGTDSTGV